MTNFITFLFFSLIGFIVGTSLVIYFFGKVLNGYNGFLKKRILYFDILNQWLIIKQKQISFYNFFKMHGYKKVAIYGMKDLGERLLNELEISNVEVSYIIDKDKGGISSKIPVYAPNDVLPQVDIIVVTAAYYYDEIVDVLKKHTNSKIISIEDMLYELDS